MPRGHPAPHPRVSIAAVTTVGSPSIEHPGYWWYRARGELLRAVFEKYVGDDGRLLDVGSADGPSVGWLRERGHRVALDVDPRGLRPRGRVRLGHPPAVRGRRLRGRGGLRRGRAL